VYYFVACLEMEGRISFVVLSLEQAMTSITSCSICVRGMKCLETCSRTLRQYEVYKIEDIMFLVLMGTF
jgi:hypothetical protein